MKAEDLEIVMHTVRKLGEAADSVNSLVKTVETRMVEGKIEIRSGEKNKRQDCRGLGDAIPRSPTSDSEEAVVAQFPGSGNRLQLTGPVDESRTKRSKREISDRKKRALSLFHSQAVHLWKLQESLRSEVMPRVRGMPADEDRLAAVCAVLEAGYSVQDCEHMLRQRAYEVKVDRRNGRWFNGDSVWRLKNFRRTLANIGTMPSRPEFAGEVALQSVEQILDQEHLEKTGQAEPEDEIFDPFKGLQ